MSDGFGWCRLLEAAKAVDAMNAVWPVLVGLAVLAMIHRQRPARPFVRLVGIFAALLLFFVAVSPHDPLSGQALSGQAVKTLALSTGLLLVLIRFMFPGHLE